MHRMEERFFIVMILVVAGMGVWLLGSMLSTRVSVRLDQWETERRRLIRHEHEWLLSLHQSALDAQEDRTVKLYNDLKALMQRHATRRERHGDEQSGDAIDTDLGDSLLDELHALRDSMEVHLSALSKSIVELRRSGGGAASEHNVNGHSAPQRSESGFEFPANFKEFDAIAQRPVGVRQVDVDVQLAAHRRSAGGVAERKRSTPETPSPQHEQRSVSETNRAHGTAHFPIAAWQQRDDVKESISVDYPMHRLAVIVPFIQDERNDVFRMLKHWREHAAPFAANSPVKSHCDLLFYYHRDEATLDSHKKTRVELTDAARRLFDRVSFVFADLSDKEDTYPMGANHMFYRLFLDERIAAHLSSQYRYAFLMETDVLAVRSAWLDVVYRHTLGADSFWMKGSQFYGRFLPSHLRAHINGNALYNVDDREFGQVLERVRNAYPISMGYDGSIYQYLLSDGGWRDWRDYAHKFVFSDFIANLYYTDYSLDELLSNHPATALVHGGNNTDAPGQSRAYKFKEN